MPKEIIDTELSQKKNDGAELAEMLKKLPEDKKERALGIIEGMALSVEAAKAAG